MKLPHIGADVVQAPEKHVDNEVQLENEASFCQFAESLFERLSSLRPVPGNLRQRQFGIGERNAARVYFVEDVDRFPNGRLQRDRLLRKLAIENVLDSLHIILDLVLPLAVNYFTFRLQVLPDVSGTY